MIKGKNKKHLFSSCDKKNYKCKLERKKIERINKQREEREEGKQTQRENF